MGMLIAALELRQPDLPYFDAAFQGPYPATPPVTLIDLESMYPETPRLLAKPMPGAWMRPGRPRPPCSPACPATRALWSHFRELSLSAQRRDFAELGAHFDLFEGESSAIR